MSHCYELCHIFPPTMQAVKNRHENPKISNGFCGICFLYRKREGRQKQKKVGKKKKKIHHKTNKTLVTLLQCTSLHLELSRGQKKRNKNKQKMISTNIACEKVQFLQNNKRKTHKNIELSQSQEYRMCACFTSLHAIDTDIY